jgi:restriction system protein
MTIPSYQTLMLPLLRLADKGEVALQDAVETLAQEFQLTSEEAAQRLPGGQRVIYNRTGWAKTELVKACLIEQPKRGSFRITQRGKDLLAVSPPTLSRNYFYEHYPEFREFIEQSQRRQGTGSEEALIPTGENTPATSSPAANTPYEQIDAAARALNSALEADLLARIRLVDPAKFEQLVVDLLISMGFGGGDPEMGERLGRSGDGGIDGVIQEDALGLDAVYVQAKRYQDGNTVGAPALQAFVGSLVGQRANKGVFVTSSKFSEQAKDYVRRVQHRIVLIDGEEFARLLVRHGVGVREDRSVTIKKMDEDYFAE